MILFDIALALNIEVAKLLTFDVEEKQMWRKPKEGGNS